MGGAPGSSRHTHARARWLCIPLGAEPDSSHPLCLLPRHGGPSAAKFVRDHLFKNLLGHHHFGNNLARAVEDAYQVQLGVWHWLMVTYWHAGARLQPLLTVPVFDRLLSVQETDEQYLELDAELQRDDGCTAVTAVLLGQRLVVAHVGDSRCGCGLLLLMLRTMGQLPLHAGAGAGGLWAAHSAVTASSHFPACLQSRHLHKPHRTGAVKGPQAQPGRRAGPH